MAMVDLTDGRACLRLLCGGTQTWWTAPAGPSRTGTTGAVALLRCCSWWRAVALLFLSGELPGLCWAPRGPRLREGRERRTGPSSLVRAALAPLVWYPKTCNMRTQDLMGGARGSGARG